MAARLCRLPTNYLIAPPCSYCLLPTCLDFGCWELVEESVRTMAEVRLRCSNQSRGAAVRGGIGARVGRRQRCAPTVARKAGLPTSPLRPL